MVNTVHHEETIEGTNSFLYSISALPIESGKRYAWRITAVDEDGYAAAENSGNSEIWEFTYASAFADPEEENFMLGMLTGNLMDASTGEPLDEADLTFRLVSFEGGMYEVVEDSEQEYETGEDGTFQFDMIPLGSHYQLTIRKANYSETILAGPDHVLENISEYIAVQVSQ